MSKIPSNDGSPDTLSMETIQSDHVPTRPRGSYRIVLNLKHKESRLDSVLLGALRAQNENLQLQNISRTTFKALFDGGKIQIKGQKARPSSSLVAGMTYVDILGFDKKS